MSIGKRKACIVGYSASFGIVINRNNIWDSGIMLTGGLGVGFELAIETPINSRLTDITDVASSTIDFTSPTSTSDIEGTSTNIYSSAGIGIGYNTDTQTIESIQTSSIGGGVYKETTIVITAGEIAENIVNTSVFVMNKVLEHSGMNRFYTFNYVELDGRE